LNELLLLPVGGSASNSLPVVSYFHSPENAYLEELLGTRILYFFGTGYYDVTNGF
jgi:hypothetical protein